MNLQYQSYQYILEYTNGYHGYLHRTVRIKELFKVTVHFLFLSLKADRLLVKTVEKRTCKLNCTKFCYHLIPCVVTACIRPIDRTFSM